MPRRRRWGRALAAGLAGAGEGVSNVLQMRMKQMQADRDAARNDTILRNRTADEKLASGEWTEEVATGYREGRPVESSFSDRAAPMLEDIGKAPTMQTVPTQEELRGRLQAKRVPLTGFGKMGDEAQPVKEEGNLPSTPMGPVVSPQLQQLLGARSAKIRSFPDEQIGQEMVGEGGESQLQNIRGRYNPDAGQMEPTVSIPAGPTATQKGTFEGEAQNTTELATRQGKIDTQVATEKALQGPRAKTAYLEAQARAKADREGAIARAAETGGLLPEQVQPAMQMADDFYRQNEKFFGVQESFLRMARLVRAAERPGALGASDVEILYAFMKMVDPGAAVQEGDKKNATSTGGIQEYVVNLYNKAKDGQIFTPEQRRDFLQAASAQYIAGKETYDRSVQTFSARANQFRIPANLVVQPPTPGLDNIGRVFNVNGKAVRVIDVTPDGQAVFEPAQLAPRPMGGNGRTGQGRR